MKKLFYPRLAWDGMRKNGRLYLPYILTCTGMVAMYYIVRFLQASPAIDTLRGAMFMREMLGFGSQVMAIFSAIFLFYTHSFLIRRRMKEFGLYNILGMGKRNIARILLWETVMVTALSLGAGLFIGAALSKLAELLMLNIMGGHVTYALSVSVPGLVSTVRVYVVIYLLMMLHSLWMLRRSSAISLLRSENAGEKPPRANWLLGLLGIALLAGAYWLAVTIKDPVTALAWFFVAVVMVIVGTYLTFIAGSVALCRILQKNKRYYYKANHFVSVSSMAYRMKRNGAGLASICILATMVLVMLASTTCLYIGGEDSLNHRYPRDINLTFRFSGLDGLDSPAYNDMREICSQQAAEYGVEPEHEIDYRYVTVNGLLRDGVVECDVSQVQLNPVDPYHDVRALYFICLEDYNRANGDSETLAPGECLIYAERTAYTEDTFAVRGGPGFRVKRHLESMNTVGESASLLMASLYIVVPDFKPSLTSLATLADYNGDSMPRYRWEYGYDLPLPADAQIHLASELEERLALTGAGAGWTRLDCESKAENRDDFFTTYGSLFLLGILLSIVFIFAAVLIIYYKQISEGYEDQARFDIMRKVGMTSRDTRRSINAQLLTVFFLPLMLAGVHLCFAFPIVQKLLMLFNLLNVPLLMATTVASYLIFALFYLAVYRMTANAYYKIVSTGMQQARG
ncbi:MAG: FtsX-like permease family protein [Aristaeellaceae bacterium]